MGGGMAGMRRRDAGARATLVPSANALLMRTRIGSMTASCSVVSRTSNPCVCLDPCIFPERNSFLEAAPVLSTRAKHEIEIGAPGCSRERDIERKRGRARERATDRQTDRQRNRTLAPGRACARAREDPVTPPTTKTGLDPITEAETCTCIRGAIWTGDEATLVTCSSDRTIKLWNVAHEKCLASLEEHADYVKALAYARDRSSPSTLAPKSSTLNLPSNPNNTQPSTLNPSTLNPSTLNPQPSTKSDPISKPANRRSSSAQHRAQL